MCASNMISVMGYTIVSLVVWLEVYTGRAIWIARYLTETATVSNVNRDIVDEVSAGGSG